MQAMRGEERKLNKNAGFSLVELLIAVTILAIIVIPLLHMFVTTSRLNGKAKQKQRATTVAQNLIEGMKAYDIDELREQFNQPVDGFYVMDSKLIHGSIKEDFDREKSDPAFSGDSSEAEPEAPGVYYFTLEDIRMQGSSYDALIKVDATGYMSGNLTSEAGSADDGKAHHDLALNGSNIAMPGSVNKGGGGAKKDGSYLQDYDMNYKLLNMLATKYGFTLEEIPTIREFISHGGTISRTITLNLRAGAPDAEGNNTFDADIRFKYNCSYKGSVTEEFIPITAQADPGPMGQPCGFTGENFYLFYYPLYGAVSDEIVINNESNQPLRLYIVKQVAKKDPSAVASPDPDEFEASKDELTDSQLNAAEMAYRVKVNVIDSGADNVKIRTNLGVNLVNAAFGGGASPHPEGTLPTTDAEKQDLPTQATFTLNGAPGINLNIFSLSGIRYQGTGTNDEITDVIFDIEVSIFKEGAYAENFDPSKSERLVVVEGSKNN